MPSPAKLSKSDARRAIVSHHFAPCATQMDAFQRLRSIQFDPIAPVGCNHDLVLQARVPGYKVGDWEKIAYQDRLIYDGWDKQASLVPFQGWPLRRIFHQWRMPRFKPLFDEYADGVEIILNDLRERGPLMPKECGFQEKRSEWKSVWYSSNVTKRILQALWHTGQVMTACRRQGQHLYDLPERVVPPQFIGQLMPDEQEATRELILERHRAVGILRFSAPMELWNYRFYAGPRKEAINQLIDMKELVPVSVEGLASHATPAFMSLLDSPPPEDRAVFIAPLDQFMWDRKMIEKLFDFEYAWEIYTPEPKRRWGYYVLPVLFGDSLVARTELWCRKGTLEMRRWHFEPQDPAPAFWPALDRALRDFMSYCSATTIVANPSVDRKVRDLVDSISPASPVHSHERNTRQRVSTLNKT